MEKLTKGILTAIAAILGGSLLLWAAAAVLIALVAATVCLLLIYLLMPKECRACVRPSMAGSAGVRP